MRRPSATHSHHLRRLDCSSSYAVCLASTLCAAEYLWVERDREPCASKPSEHSFAGISQVRRLCKSPPD